MEQEIEICPYCGHEARVYAAARFKKKCDSEGCLKTGRVEQYQVRCKKKGCIAHYEYFMWWENEDDAIEAWNRRV